jgi:plasmid replication initiation protein
MSNEIVKHHNDLNTVIMRKWTAEEMNFFFAIITKVRDEGTRLMKFDTDELRYLASKDFHLDRWSQTMKSVADKVVDLKYYERTEHSYAVMNLFSYFRVDEKECVVEVEVSSKFEYVINKLEAQFTQYELAEFTNIRSTYAKTAYRLLKQWRTVGRKEFKIDEFKLLLDMPSSYKSSEIDRAVIAPILKQLSPYFEDLKVKKIKSKKRGNPVLGYEFTWKKEVTGTYDPDKFNKPKPEPKKASKSKSSKKTNVPKWSNPEYKNTTSEDKKLVLAEYKQICLEISETKDEDKLKRLNERKNELKKLLKQLESDAKKEK